MLQFKITLPPKLEIHNGQIWRIDWSEESKKSLEKIGDQIQKDFVKDCVYQYINMIGVQGVVFFD